MALFDSSIGAFAAVSLIVNVTPGPDTMLIIRNTLARGRRGGLFSIMGVLTGGLIQASAATFGLSRILLGSSELYTIVKLAGAIYLIYLGIQNIRSGLSKKVVASSTGPGGFSPPIIGLREGFLTNALNPKVAVFFLAFLPQFIGPSDPVIAKTILLVGIHYTLGIVWLAVITQMVHRAAALFQKSNFKRNLEVAAGAVFVGLGAKLAFEKR